MTEFITYVLIPADTRDVAGTVRENMDRYDGRTRVKPHHIPCFCVVEPIVTRYTELGEADRSRTLKDFWDLIDPTSAQPDCEMCDGTGLMVSDRNPDVAWMQWEWEPLPPDVRRTAWADAKTALLRDDCVPLRFLDVDRLPIPFAVVTPDRELHRPGVWLDDRIIDEDEHWPARVREMLTSHRDALLVFVRCWLW